MMVGKFGIVGVILFLSTYILIRYFDLSILYILVNLTAPSKIVIYLNKVMCTSLFHRHGFLSHQLALEFVRTR